MSSEAIAVVDKLVDRAREAQAGFERGASQERYDCAAKAAAWAILEEARNRTLAELAVQTTGLGNVPDKIVKNHRKTLGLMRDIADAKTFGVVSDNKDTGITEIARPLGVIGAVTPSTNPGATPANNVINALKCGNAIVLSPSPSGVAVCETFVGYVHAEFAKTGVPQDLVQMLPPPGGKAQTQRMLEIVDLAVVTGSQDNVRRAYSSGTPAVGVGAGNVTVIVDETADPTDAAAKIAASKCFDNATSCSSENAVIVLDEIYESFVSAMAKEGGALVAEQPELIERLWPGGKLNKAVLARGAEDMLAGLEMTGQVPLGTRFLAVETEGVGPEHPLSGEKLSLVLALYRARDFTHATEIASRILAHQGAGHSIGLHSALDERALWLGEKLPTCRVIVNQAHCFATGGSFDNGMPFSLSMGCGSWGGNSIDDNLHWRHFTQKSKVIRRISSREPALEDIFADYWSEAGR
ncbi:MAG: aldehyde dehydrogenase family protein [Rhodobacteraceae bacterium]|nr:aldehyde dehydrogenase family protein [Paracoccaceae bacterium]